MRILIVDDDDIAIAMMRKVLASAGHEVEVASDGQEALEKLRETGIRMVISDWVMPRLDGIDLCQKIREDFTSSYVYIVLITSKSEQDDVLNGLQAGADEFLTKPFDPAELLVRVNTANRILALETRHVTIFALAKLAESRDPETGLHLDRMRLYSRTLAEEISQMEDFQGLVTASFAENIYQTSPLHDIGKVGIPDYVLLKPGRLDDAEFVVMKQHATIGGETLGAALDEFPGVEFLRMARDIAMSHHERFDGSGYPNGLKGTDIPLEARIVALADVYDALTMKRCYKSAYPHDIAKKIILEGSDSHFDSRVVQAFLQREEDFKEIKLSLMEE